MLKTKKIRLFNAEFTDISLNDLLRNIREGVLVTPNVDHLIKLQKDEGFYKIYQKADWVICDSNIVQLGLKFLNKPVKEVIPGSSFLPAYYNYHRENREIKIFLLGSMEGVADKAKSRINRKVGWDIVVGAHSPSFGFEESQKECMEIVSIIKDSGANVLVVGVGAPKQEKWIFQYKDKLIGIRLFMALGATIDFEAGIVNRAPEIYQNLGLEWLYRLAKEPGRLWKRYLVDDMPFFYLLLKEKIGSYKNPFT
ncbi:MAG: WecB/TagA/CpsF family glycosyltransferase [Cytophagales bacterium]|nr:WecB/TagA/CpsF family glycosyltransferase [Cytophagales bacterium]